MFAVDVHHQVVLPERPLRTVRALIGPFLGVRPLVTDQVPGVREGRGAHVAVEGPLARVRAEVAGQGGFGREPLATHGARSRS